ncbi:MAG: hypothetical protein AB7S77_13765 [Desulfatirhabdiaceae bacterium]
MNISSLVEISFIQKGTDGGRGVVVADWLVIVLEKDICLVMDWRGDFSKCGTIMGQIGILESGCFANH